MKERPILFSGAMILDLLAGTKIQTRRVMKQQPPERWSPVTLSGEPDLQARTYTQGVVDRDGYLQAGPEVFGVADEEWGSVSPFGQPGDRLWVRESCWIYGCWQPESDYTRKRFHPMGNKVAYQATDEKPTDGLTLHREWRSTPSIHMPRWASRILLEVTRVRVERLRDARESDLLDELGDMLDDPTSTAGRAFNHAEHHSIAGVPMLLSPEMYGFKAWWDEKHGCGSFDSNPWVWIVEFKLVNKTGCQQGLAE